MQMETEHLYLPITVTEPLIIKNAKGSCGCTVPTWPREPIMPGETSKIGVKYATNRVGKLLKQLP